MPAFKLSNPLRRDPARPSLKTRAAALRASAARVIGSKPAGADDPVGGRPCPSGVVPDPSEPDAASDLARCTLPQLARLQEQVQALWQHINGAICAPCFCASDEHEDFNAAGRILDAAGDRLDDLLGAIRAEAERRTPDGRTEADERLGILLRSALFGEARPDDALIAELAAARNTRT